MLVPPAFAFLNIGNTEWANSLTVRPSLERWLPQPNTLPSKVGPMLLVYRDA
eukprot:m.74476 g.74476  ORF g.74476 m.74476 type:complete len:52 (+) comp13944_c1_seq2:162-317(+)